MAQSPEFKIFEDLISFLPFGEASKRRKAINAAEHEQHLRAFQNVNRAADDTSAQTQASTASTRQNTGERKTANRNIKAGNDPETLFGLGGFNDTQRVNQGAERNRLHANSIEDQKEKFNQNKTNQEIADLQTLRNNSFGNDPVRKVATNALLKKLGLGPPSEPNTTDGEALLNEFNAGQAQNKTIAADTENNFLSNLELSPGATILSDFASAPFHVGAMGVDAVNSGVEGVQNFLSDFDRGASNAGPVVEGGFQAPVIGGGNEEAAAPEGGLIQAIAELVLGDVGDDINAQRQQAQRNMKGSGVENPMFDDIYKMLQSQPQSQMFK
jgi:hypothetical protein